MGSDVVRDLISYCVRSSVLTEFELDAGEAANEFNDDRSAWVG